MCRAVESRQSARLVGASEQGHLGEEQTHKVRTEGLGLVLLALLVMVGASGSLRTSPPSPPPPGTGVTSSPFDPLWGPAPPAFFSVDTNGTGLADATPKNFLENSHAFTVIKYTIFTSKCIVSLFS